MTQPPQASKVVTIQNKQGLHARPIMQFVDLANTFQSSISVTREDREVDGKSPMEIMLLEATCGTHLTLQAVGPDAVEAVQALADLIAGGFGNEPDPTGSGTGSRA